MGRCRPVLRLSLCPCHAPISRPHPTCVCPCKHASTCAGIGVACGSDHSLVAAAATLLALCVLGSYRFAYGSEKAESDSWGPERPVEPAAKNVKKTA